MTSTSAPTSRTTPTSTGKISGRRIAVVLFNLGGPDDAETVQPFLFNLFNDPAIIGLPGFVRTPLARLISSRREASAQANYAQMDANGGSPLKAETRKQMAALDAALSRLLPGDEMKSFMAMRYWHPLSEVARTRWFCCRCIRSFPPPRRHRRSRPGVRPMRVQAE